MHHQRPSSAPAWRAYSRRQAAEILDVPISTIDAAIARGELGSVRLGKHIRISDSALRQYAGQEPLKEIA